MDDAGALQAALAAEQAIVYGYGVAGAHLTGSGRAYAAACLRAHQQRRDRLIAVLHAMRIAPTPASPAYHVQVPGGPTQARRLAAQLEAGGAGAAWDLATASPPSSSARKLAVAWLEDAAVRISRWGAAVPPLPGQPV